MSAWVFWTALMAVGAEPAAPKVDPRVKAAVEKTGAAIDGCVAAYLAEQPAARGTATVTTTHGRNGQVLIAEVDTPLPSPRRLASCLDGVARSWTLPPIQQDRGKLEIVVAIYPGAKFDLDPPKEKSKDPEPEAPPRPLGEFTFTPGGFTNGEWGAGDAPLPGETPETGQGTGEAPEEGQGTGAAPEDGPGTGEPGEDGA